MRHHIGQAELGFEGGGGREVARDVQGGLIGVHAQGRDVVRAQPLLAQRQRGVDGGEGVAAAAVVLLGDRQDVIALAQAIDRGGPVRILR
ncbi:hypothetical protein D3C71_1790960 [compost metagenome]